MTCRWTNYLGKCWAVDFRYRRDDHIYIYIIYIYTCVSLMHMSNWEKCCWDSQGFFPRYQAKTSPPRTRRRKSVMQSTWLPSLGCTWGSMGWLGESWNGNQLNGFLLLAIQSQHILSNFKPSTFWHEQHLPLQQTHQVSRSSPWSLTS